MKKATQTSTTHSHKNGGKRSKNKLYDIILYNPKNTNKKIEKNKLKKMWKK